MNAFVSGHSLSVNWLPANGGISLIQVKDASWDEEINTILVTHSGTGGLAARIANVLDGRGTWNASFDADLPPYINPPRIIPGQNALYLFFVSLAKPAWQIPVIVKKLHYSYSVASEVVYSVDVELNALAGSYVRPLT